MRLLRQYDDRVNLGNIGQVPFVVRLRVRTLDAARTEADIELAKRSNAVATIPIHS